MLNIIKNTVVRAVTMMAFLSVSYVALAQPSSTPANTSTSSPTATFTVTRTASVTKTKTITPTPRNTSTRTPTATPSSTYTATRTNTATASASVTRTATGTKTVTRTRVPSTPTKTPVNTATITQTKTATVGPSVTPTSIPTRDAYASKENVIQVHTGDGTAQACFTGANAILAKPCAGVAISVSNTNIQGTPGMTDKIYVSYASALTPNVGTDFVLPGATKWFMPPQPSLDCSKVYVVATTGYVVTCRTSSQ